MGLRNQAEEAQGTRGGRILKEPGARAGRDSSPVVLEPSKDPFRPSLIGEKHIIFDQKHTHTLALALALGVNAAGLNVTIHHQKRLKQKH